MTEPLFQLEPYSSTCTARVIAAGPQGIELDRSIFYPNGGGQPGDTGRLLLPGVARVVIINTVKGAVPPSILHVLADGADLPEVGTEVTAELDWDRRHRHMRMHTCLHLLSALVPYPVTGGSVGDGKGRLDFDVSGELADKDQLTEKLMALVSADAVVTARWITDEELLASPELVKTMSVKPPMGQGRIRLIEVAGIDRPIDLQACGGTHVARTGEIGAVAVRKIESKGRQNKRINLEFS